MVSQHPKGLEQFKRVSCRGVFRGPVVARTAFLAVLFWLPLARALDHPVIKDSYSALVTASSKLYGRTNKTGVLPKERWVDDLFNDTAFREHVLRTHVYGEQLDQAPPMAYKCGVFINPVYKFIFIRNRKSASTSVLDTFKSACKNDSRLCTRRMSPEDLAALAQSPDELWRTYFVATTLRNPLSRAVSGYDYIIKRWPTPRKDICSNVSFPLFARNPYILGIMGNLFRCGAPNSHREDDVWAYDFYHVEPAHHCLLDPRGGLVVDFLIRYEHLQEDYAAFVDAFNARRPAGLPAFTPEKLGWMKQGSHVQAVRQQTGKEAHEVADLVPTDRHAATLRACGQPCVDSLQAFYQTDLDVMARTPL